MKGYLLVKELKLKCQVLRVETHFDIILCQDRIIKAFVKKSYNSVLEQCVVKEYVEVETLLDLAFV